MLIRFIDIYFIFNFKLNSLFVPIYSISNDPKYFPNPDVFDPERFSDENKHKITPGTYLPFGIGPRNCIGEQHLLIQSILKLYSNTFIISRFTIRFDGIESNFVLFTVKLLF